MSTANDNDRGRPYHTQCTGPALATVSQHKGEADITLFGGCFCPFVQRVWVAFEYMGIPYKVYEVDPYKKPQDLLEVSPKGLVPALRFNRYNPPRALNESTVIMEFLEDLASSTTKRTLLPPLSNPYARALVRLQADHISRTIVPAFYRYLQAQESEEQIAKEKDFHAAIDGAGERVALKKGLGLWIESEGGQDLGWSDVMVAPWILRAKIVLRHYRGFDLAKGERFNAWVNRLLEHPAFKATCSAEQLYLDSYERYAFNRPNTSQVADAINQGKALP
ncbi:uncharacterized protein LACBIDRAFT_231002 [Laccaria bicolor S238N-H82]|uniref:Predicted protein n=1 Tax=Laccaria bicolor (strain S238N-H82 / ATCC MYA-4686) TaxID=486041 RepID=B0CZV3_LACBS|nr:uncharacterized protein LACBIDRAFT_231002 [Laccaria bicolor S238N-H82]EDR12218.1 predicted protein [Laccaria bicolor S238N-H82]|eukprot:XP_001876482.1 predicted protein [Laccaria bicolor S238N-H82]